MSKMTSTVKFIYDGKPIQTKLEYQSELRFEIENRRNQSRLADENPPMLKLDI